MTAQRFIHMTSVSLNNKLPALMGAMFLCLLTSSCASMMSVTHKGQIKDDVSKRTWGRWLDDEIVENKVKANIKKANKLFKNAHVLAVCYNGTLLLAGQVPDESLVQTATRVAKQTKGVQYLYNELEIRGPTAYLSRTSDAWITSKVKTFLLFTKRTPGKRTKVVTENGTVFLLGLVSTKEADDIVATVQRIHGVERIVKMFEYIDG